jgi:hypothetical protein
VFEVSGEEKIGRFVNREDAFIGDELIGFEVMFDEDGNPVEGQEMDGIKTDTDIRDNPEFKLSDDFKGKIDKEATAKNTDIDIPQPSGGGDGGGDKSAEEQFFAEANKAWARGAGHSEKGRQSMAKSSAVKDGYAVSNPHETVAKGVEAFESGDENAIEEMHEEYPEMLAALSEIMEPSDELTELLTELGVN